NNWKCRKGRAPTGNAKGERNGNENGRTTSRDIMTPARNKATTGAEIRKSRRRSVGFSAGATKRQNSYVIRGDTRITARNTATFSWTMTASHGVTMMSSALPRTREWFRRTITWAGIVFPWSNVGTGSQTVVEATITGSTVKVSMM